MRMMWNALKSSSRTFGAGLAALLCLGALALPAAAQKVVLSQVTRFGLLTGGGAYGSQEAAGTTPAVNAAANIFFVSTGYGGKLLEFNTQTGALLQTISYSVGSLAVDPQGNLYIGDEYDPNITKVPFVNGAYPTITSSASTTCTGTGDTVECALPGLSTGITGKGYVGMAFDGAGDLFFSTQTGLTTPSGAIFEATAASLATGSPTATQIFAEPTAAATQLYLGGMAADATGNLYFTDSEFPNADNGTEESFSSNVKELPYNGTAYATTPTTLYNETNASPSSYDNFITSVAVVPGTLYFSDQNNGMFAMPVSGGVVNTAGIYAVSTQGAKEMTTDGAGNFYIAVYDSVDVPNGDTAFKIGINNLALPNAPVGGTASTASVLAITNDGTCTAPETLSFSSTNAAFTATAGTTCSSVGITGAGSYPVTLSFAPTAGGLQSATLTTTDSLSNSGTATLSGTGVATAVSTPTFTPPAGTYSSTQTVAISAQYSTAIYYTTDGSTPTSSSTLYTAPITVAQNETVKAIGTASSLTTSPVGTAAYVISAAAPTFTPAAGTYTGTQTVFLASTTPGATFYYTTNGTTPTTSSTLYTSAGITVSASETIEAITVAPNYGNSTVASAAYTIGSAGPPPVAPVVLSQVATIAAFPNGGVQSSGNYPGTEMVVTPQGNIIAVEPNGNDVLEINTATGVVTTLASGFNGVGAVTSDANHNLYISTLYDNSQNIVKIPYIAGSYSTISNPTSSTPACTGVDTAECYLPNLTDSADGYYIQVRSMAFDAAGDLFIGTGEGQLLECTATCLTTGTPSTAVLYNESSATGPNTNGAAFQTGAIAVDAGGNVFFTDSDYEAGPPSYTPYSYVSNLKELVYTTGTGYAASPVTLYTYTPSLPPGGNTDEITGLAVANNTVYFSTLYDGIFAFAETGGSVTATTPYAVSTQGGKVLATNGSGTFYVDSYTTADTLLQINVGSIAVPIGTIGGTPTTSSNVTALLNDGTCASPETLSFTSTSSEFTATAGTTCTSTLSGGGSYPVTVSFAPTSTGTQTATLTATDSMSNTGTATVTGPVNTPTAPPAPTFSVAAGTYSSTQSVTISDTESGVSIYYTTNGSTPTASSTLYTGPVSVASSETLEAIAVLAGQSSTVASATYTINLPAAATPSFSPAAGTYTSAQTVTISDSTSGATIYYTTDGSTPTTGSTVYSAPIPVGSTKTINAIATAPNYSTSAVGTALYTINLPAATPTFSPAAGTYATAQTVTISSTTPNATIYYSITGTATTSSTVYTGPISVTASETISAVAIASGYSVSTAASAAYVIETPAATPTFSPGAGTYTSIQTVTISTATPSATIYYTTNGSTPTTSSSVYGGPITVSSTETIQAIATASGYTTSAVGSAAYTINLPTAATPTFSPAAGTYTSTQTVTISTATAGATIYYTTNGSTPTVSSTKYTGAITVNSTETIEAIAVETGYLNSSVASGLFTINLPPPSFSLGVSPALLSVNYGSTGTATVTVTPINSFASPVSFSCSGLPYGSVCSFSPSTVTPSGGNATTTLTVTPPASSPDLRAGNRYIPGAGVATAALCLLFFRKRRRLQIVLMLLAGVAGMGMMMGCGSSSSSQPALITYNTVTVTGTSGTLSETATFTLNVK